MLKGTTGTLALEGTSKGCTTRTGLSFRASTICTAVPSQLKSNEEFSRMLTLSRRAKLAIALLGSMTATTMLNAAEDSPARQASDLPLGRVVLFSSGVGFYEHDGEVTDDAKVELKFNVDDVNDLLKSMVLQDLGGGK